MKILLVRNSVSGQSLLEKAFSRGNDVTTIPWDGFKDIDTSTFDLAVLSGSSNFPVVGNENQLVQELDFIRSTDMPVLGICYGSELITTAFGGTLKILPHKERGVIHVSIERTDPIFNGIDDLFVYEGHRWTIDTVPEGFIPLASSPHGIETIRHSSRIIYGLQFHPEKLQHETVGEQIVENFLALIR